MVHDKASVADTTALAPPRYGANIGMLRCARLRSLAAFERACRGRAHEGARRDEERYGYGGGMSRVGSDTEHVPFLPRERDLSKSIRPVVAMPALFAALTFTLACGDDFDRAETSTADAGVDDAGAGKLDQTSGDGSGGSSDGTSGKPDAASTDGAATDGTAGGGGFPGVGDACKAAADCGNDPDPCVVWACPAGVCALAFATDGKTCDDGEKCTEKDACKAGKCVGGANTCHCTKSSDCAKNDDGDLCNGTLYCDTTKKPAACVVNPVTVKTCHGTDNTDCRINTCEPKTGTCAMKAVADGKACDDGSACTDKDACVSGSCKGDKAACECVQDKDCAAKDDGKACNGTLYCDRGSFPFKCATNPATLIYCTPGDDTTCSKNTCQEAGIDALAGCAMVPMPAKVTCDDGNPCTANDACKAGKCESGTNSCACQTNTDCAKHEDGNACNGTLFCDQGANPVACAVNPASVVTCTDTDDTVCRKNTCDAKTGKCGMTDQKDGSTCEDGNVCTQKDGCEKGACKPGKNDCKCTKDADCGAFDDDNKCSGSLFCDTSAAPFTCELNLKSVVTCTGKGNTDCTKEACNPKTGACDVSLIADGTACDADGNACTAKDTCSNGLCKPGKNACACTKDADCAKHEDGDACNGTLFCDTQAQPFACRVWQLSIQHCTHDGTPCSDTKCDPKTGKCGKVADDENETCIADGGGCFVPGTCKSGACKAGSKTCACTKDADCDDKDDGDKCNGVFHCDKSTTPALCKAKPNSFVACPPGKDDGPCKHTECVPETGSCQTKTLKAGEPCDDGDVCTPDEVCDAQQLCSSKTSICGCADVSDCTPLLKGNKCLGSYACVLNGGIKACVKKKGEKTCADGNNPCAERNCDPKDGLCKSDPLQHMEGKVCPDNDKCVDVAVCKLGKCEPKTKVKCQAKGPCRPQSCETGKGCVEKVLKSGPCDDGNACTNKSSCDNGTCKSGKTKTCQDNNLCTKDSCDTKTGDCKYEVRLNEACTDNLDKCLLKGVCVAVSLGAACSPTVLKDCDDKDACTTDSCDPTKGCVFDSAKKCDDGSVCTTDACKQGACTHAPASGACKLFGQSLTCNAGICGSQCELWSKTYEADKSGKDGSFEAIALLPTSSSFNVFAVGASNKGKGAPWTTQIDDAGKVLLSEQSTKKRDHRWRAIRLAGKSIVLAGSSDDNKKRMFGHLRVLKRETGKLKVAENRQIAGANGGQLEFYSVEIKSSTSFIAVGVETSTKKVTRGLVYRVDDKLNKKSGVYGVPKSRFMGSTSVKSGIVICGDRPSVSSNKPDIGLLAAFTNAGKWFRSYHYQATTGTAVLHGVAAKSDTVVVAAGGYKNAAKKAVPTVIEVDFSKAPTKKLAEWQLPSAAPTLLYAVDVAQEGAFVAGTSIVGTTNRGFVGLIGPNGKTTWTKTYAVSGNSYLWDVRWTGLDVIAAGHTHPNGQQRAWMVRLDFKGNLYCSQ